MQPYVVEQLDRLAIVRITEVTSNFREERAGILIFWHGYLRFHFRSQPGQEAHISTYTFSLSIDRMNSRDFYIIASQPMDQDKHGPKL